MGVCPEAKIDILVVKVKRERDVLCEELQIAGITRGEVIEILKIIKGLQRRLQKALD